MTTFRGSRTSRSILVARPTRQVPSGIVRQGAAAKDWLAAREADLLPVPYYHVVFTLPAAIADIAYQNKAIIYDILFKASAETMLTIAAVMPPGSENLHIFCHRRV